ncbi:hypothetical protein [Stenotrophomonas maltophilia]|uniref:hypothetical protein n=1 Tax=Stenotrophomonas maltophilia TaxID=40324 RepID=UPI0034D52268
MDWVMLIGTAGSPGGAAAPPGGVAWGALLGIVIGWILKTATDVFMEHRRRREAAEARREQRFDALRSRRIEAERANLLALQPMVTDFMLAGAYCSRAPRHVTDQGDLVGAEFEDQREAMRLQSAAMMSIRARLHDREIAVLLGRLTLGGLQAVQQPHPTESVAYWEGIIPMAQEAHNVIGAAIRRLEDESIQLVAPPVQS